MQVAAQPGVAPSRGVTWTLPTSTYFIQRKQTAESRDFGDMERVWAQQFAVDWGRVVAKERFVAMVGRSDKALLARDAEQLQRGALQLSWSCEGRLHAAWVSCSCCPSLCDVLLCAAAK